jgi:hypothetical protein
MAHENKAGVEKNKNSRKIKPSLMKAILREVARAIG